MSNLGELPDFIPKHFEDEYPRVAEFLYELYRKPRFICDRGHIHALPYRLHCGLDYCQKLPLHQRLSLTDRRDL